MTLSNFNKKEEYNDGKYKVYSFSGEKGNFRRLSCSSESICILPFDVNENNQITNVYLSRYKDHLTGKDEYTCMTKTFNPLNADSYFDLVENCVADELGLKEFELDDAFLLGKVKHGVPFSKEYRCYGINLSNYMQDPSGYVVKGAVPNPKMDSIDRIKFNRILKGEVNDTLALSCAMLLISYISE